MEVTVSIILMFVMIISGIEVAFAFGACIIWLVFSLGYSPSFLFPTGYSMLKGAVLLAIPLFIIAGAVMEKGKIGQALIDLVQVFLGRVRGSLGIVTVVACAVFSSICGSGAATLSCIGSVMAPIMKKEKYPSHITAAIVCCAGPIGLVLPPSVAQILYAWSGQLSVLACFLAIVGPGLLLTLLLSICSWFLLKDNKDLELRPRLEGKLWFKDFTKKTTNASFALFMPVIILGGIYGGFFTPTEAAAVSVVYAIPVALFAYRGVDLRGLKEAFIDSSRTIGVIMAMFFLVISYSKLLIMENFPDMLSNLISSISDNPYMIMMMINVFMILIGALMDDVSAILLCTPMLLPIVRSIGMSPIHFAAVLGINLGMGNITPPNAPFIFLSARICDASVSKMLKPIFFLLLFAYLPTLILTTYVPDLSLFLPNLLLKR